MGVSCLVAFEGSQTDDSEGWTVFLRVCCVFGNDLWVVPLSRSEVDGIDERKLLLERPNLAPAALVKGLPPTYTASLCATLSS